MESPIPDDKSLSFITFSEDDWKLSSPSLTIVQHDTEESLQDIRQQRPEELRSLWHEIGFTFSIANLGLVKAILVNAVILKV
jgi:hypothetical protein